MKYSFHTAKKLLKICNEEKLSISEIVIRREVENHSEDTREDILKKMEVNWNFAIKAVRKGLENEKSSIGRMVRDEAKKLYKIENSVFSPLVKKAVSYAIANNICNACMGKIVATPTAGASGVLPGVLLATQEELGISDEEIIRGFFTAAGIGMIIAENASVSGAEGGCQAEIGSAAAMAAAAFTELRGGTPNQCMHAAALSLKNHLGLVCDPIGGMVEIPCVKRNGFAANHAITASEMALSGITSFIPLDEVIYAMKNIGKMISPKLRETALGGLAITDTAKKQEADLGLMIKKCH